MKVAINIIECINIINSNILFSYKYFKFIYAKGKIIPTYRNLAVLTPTQVKIEYYNHYS